MPVASLIDGSGFLPRPTTASSHPPPVVALALTVAVFRDATYPPRAKSSDRAGSAPFGQEIAVKIMDSGFLHGEHELHSELALTAMMLAMSASHQITGEW